MADTLSLLLALTAWLLLIRAAWIDWRSGILPDAVILPAALLAIIAGCLQGNARDAVFGSALGFGLFTGVQVFFRLCRKKDALGSGDAKLMLALGALAGIGKISTVILVSCGVALIFADEKEIRFGPYLVGFGLPVTFIL